MPGTERLLNFPVSTNPVGADILYMGDSTNGFNEEQVTISNVLKNVTARVGSGFLATNSGSGTSLSPVAPTIVGGALTSQALTPGNTYITESSNLVTYTLPATAAVGDFYTIIGASPLGWNLAVNNNTQSFYFNGGVTGLGLTGVVVTPSSQFAAITIECVTANVDFSITESNSPLTLVTG